VEGIRSEVTLAGKPKERPLSDENPTYKYGAPGTAGEAYSSGGTGKLGDWIPLRKGILTVQRVNGGGGKGGGTKSSRARMETSDVEN